MLVDPASERGVAGSSVRRSTGIGISPGRSTAARHHAYAPIAGRGRNVAGRIRSVPRSAHGPLSSR